MKKIFILMAGFLLMSATLYAGNGDLTVNGKVGIGTSAPGAKLEVYNSTADSQINITTSGDESGYPGTKKAAYTKYKNSDQSQGWLTGLTNWDRAGNYSIMQSESPYTRFFTIDSAGKVGIGTPNPDSGHALTVIGPALIGGVRYPSDKKFKKNIQDLTDSLDKILSIEGVSYEFKTDEYPEKGFTEGKHYGVIAQDLEKIFPELVVTNDKDEKAVDYIEIIPVLIEAIKSQQKKIDDLQSTVTQLQSKSK